MASSAQNKLMTNIGPGTPAGNVLRSFWQPVALAEELRSEGRPGGLRDDAAVLSYEPGVVDTPMQTRARSGGDENSAWRQPFRDFKEQGLLEKPEDVIRPVVEFLSGDVASAFVEKRFGG